ncbi:MAG: metal-dependent phosphohydrolase [Symploca sp. SIO3E6]|nr:metal-dependent phosphohydrolase [Caldora sp. SIO3E6]
MNTISKSQTRLIKQCINYLETEYEHIYGKQYPEYIELIHPIATLILELIACCDARYHNLEHTVQVVLVGQKILYGKHLCREPISPSEWFHFIISLLCHDIGYLKGICGQDQPEQQIFVTGVNDGRVTFPPQATGASLTPYHVDRGKLFVKEKFSNYPLIDQEKIQLNIELTRFPVPQDNLYQDTLNFPGLARAADLIGQLADPAYLSKLPALFSEFEEVGSNKVLGYTSPKDLRAGYPKFYWQGVSLYLKHGIRYLEVSQSGQAILENLYNNRSVVEKELARYYNHSNNYFSWLFGWLKKTH